MTELPPDWTGKYGWMGLRDVEFLRWAAQVPAVEGSMLNVGCYLGLSCSVLATSSPLPLVCVDPFDGQRDTLVGDPAVPASYAEWDQNMRQCGVRDRIAFFRGRSDRVLPKLLERGIRFRVALIDGSHRYDDVLGDIVLSWKMLLPGGILIADDAIGFAEIGHALRESEITGELSNNPRWSLCGDKMAFAVKGRPVPM